MVATHLRIVRQNVNRILLVIISVNYRQIGYNTYSQQNQKSDRCDLLSMYSKKTNLNIKKNISET